MPENKETITLELGVPELTVEPTTEIVEIPEQKDITAHYLENTKLTEAEQKMVDDFSEKIDLNDSGIVLQYGSAAQKKIADFSDNALEGVRTKDLGEVGNMIIDLVAELKGFNIEPEEKKGFFSIFKKAGSGIAKLKTKYDKAEVNVDRITGVLEDHQNQLLTDIVMLDKMYENNLSYFKELTMYILAGKKKLEQERATTLIELEEKAKTSGLAEDAQAANDFANLCNRFEKKLHDLEMTRTISIQMAPQIRLIQNNDIMMIEKIQTTIVNTIPLWKNQMVIALGLAHTQQAIEAERSVTDMTNQLLKQNAEALRVATVAAAEESERGIVDIETLTETNQKLIATMDDVLRIQREGHDKRVAAEAELVRMENELHRKLLEVANVETENK